MAALAQSDMRIGLLATLRDEIVALPRFFSLLEELEADPIVERLFCSFYENDSSDETLGFVCLAETSSGNLQSEHLGAPRLRGREISRTMRMAEARNKALAGFADESLDWLVVIDADLHMLVQPHLAVNQGVAARTRRSHGLRQRSFRTCLTSSAAAPGAITTVLLVDHSGRQGITGARESSLGS